MPEQRLTQSEIDRLVDLHRRDVVLRQQPACCDGRFCLSGPCPETAKMLYHKFPRESVLKRLLAETRREPERLMNFSVLQQHLAETRKEER